MHVRLDPRRARPAGTYTFAVGAAAPPGTTLQAGPLDSEGPLGLIGEFVALVELTVWVGSVLLRSVALPALTKRRLCASPGRTGDGRRRNALALASTALVASVRWPRSAGRYQVHRGPTACSSSSPDHRGRRRPRFRPPSSCWPWRPVARPRRATPPPPCAGRRHLVVRASSPCLRLAVRPGRRVRGAANATGTGRAHAVRRGGAAHCPQRLVNALFVLDSPPISSTLATRGAAREDSGLHVMSMPDPLHPAAASTPSAPLREPVRSS